MVQDRIVLTRTSCLNPVTGGKNRKALLAIRSTVLSVLSFPRLSHSSERERSWWGHLNRQWLTDSTKEQKAVSKINIKQ